MTKQAAPERNRIETCFDRLKSEKAKAFIPYVCAGDPEMTTTIELSLTMERAGADILELGVPFSDPLADGIVNQLAAQRALAAGTTVQSVLDAVGEIRSQSSTPIVLYTYLNPIVQFGFEKFHDAAAEVGVDGLLILDMPPEEEPQDPVRQLPHIRLIAPTTSADRIALIAKNARGFLYYVSREGVTGARGSIATSLGAQVAQIRRFSTLPIAVGFGISTPEQAKTVAQHADAVVVGSAIVNLVAMHGRNCLPVVREFVSELLVALR